MLSDDIRSDIIIALFGQLRKLLTLEENITRTLVNLQPEGENMDDVTRALLQRLDDATSAIALKLQALVDAANAAGSATAAEIDAALTPEIEKLESLGKP